MLCKTPLRIAAALALCLSSGPLAAQDPVVNFSPEDAEMSAAIEEARSHLDFVLARLTTDDGGLHPALNLKARLPVDHFDVDDEVIWVEHVALSEDGRFTGKLANDPAYLPGLSLGDTVSFERDQIADWSVLSTDGRMYGHYTTRVMLPHLSRSEAEQVGDLLSPDPIPEAWR
ncbi:YegJ family protein [Sagittula stellata]|uniref:DUF2314 domain-containing protein n=1 Tax=Sagittula stellata (strain ATCC 700073 / DSM 11524 / E-37) TaxID=388399 RepID=A3JZN8_SAGS3|nr:DUF2314 domain-containing protein [Sagittula stellata]EBA09941.1 hypothetical protein SSE37_09033 [Sagittula stellata E-37]